jgi:hypothetical protein
MTGSLRLSCCLPFFLSFAVIGCLLFAGTGCAGAAPATGTAPDTGATTTLSSGVEPGSLSYAMVDTGQIVCYNATSPIESLGPGDPFYGQDAQHAGNQPSYTLSGDGLTVHDNVTGLTWMKSPDLNGDGVINISDKLSEGDARSYPDTLNQKRFGGFDDWRLPSIKELYSLIIYTGAEANPNGPVPTKPTPFIDTDYFDFAYGDTAAGERAIDSQYVSSTRYVSTTMGGNPTVFGVNFADGRIKGYPISIQGRAGKLFVVLCVRGNPAYGTNDFRDNGDGTISDLATGLKWAQADSGQGLNWQQALAWAQAKNAEQYLAHSDWRLPNAKELQSLVDYTRSPDTTSSAAIDPLFSCTGITNEAGAADYPSYWTSTTHLSETPRGSSFAVYVSFGRAMGHMNEVWLDVHGAGAQRSDSKEGDPSLFPQGDGPQGDAIRIYNYVRLVRDLK